MLKSNPKQASLLAVLTAFCLALTQILVGPASAQFGAYNGLNNGVAVSAPVSIPISSPYNDVITGSILKIYAAGTQALDESPIMTVFVDYQYQAHYEVAGNPYAGEFEEYTVKLPTKVKASQIQIGFTNDYVDLKTGEDRNLRVDRINLDGEDFQTESQDTYSVGSWVAGSAPCEPGFAKSEWLFCNGYLAYMASQSHIKATATCEPAHYSVTRDHVDFKVEVIKPFPAEIKDFWTTLTDQKTGAVALYSYWGGGHPSWYILHDLLWSIRGELVVMPLMGDGRNYEVKIYTAPYTTGMPDLTNLLAEATFSVSCPFSSANSQTIDTKNLQQVSPNIGASLVSI